MRKIRIYLYCSWVAAFLGWFFIRGGYHSEASTTEAIRWYGRTLVVLLHAMMLFSYFFLEDRPKRVLVTLAVVSVSLLVCYGVLR
jgi:hypothetical protein